MVTHTTRHRARLEDLPPEKRAKAEAALARARTPEAKAEEQAIRATYADRPSVQKMVERGDLDPESVTAGNVRYALLRAVAALRTAREARGMSLADVSQRSGLDRAALSRLENEHNINPKLETLGRYAGALGLEISVTINDPGE